MHYTLPQLIALDERYPTQRKLLLVPSINFGRELLAALAHERGAWVGWEAATLATIAQKLALMDMWGSARRRASDIAIADIIDRAYDHSSAQFHAGKLPGFSSELAALTWNAGTRGAVIDAILELRTAGLTSDQVKSVGDIGVAPSLAEVLAEYEGMLAQTRSADTSEVFRAALNSFEVEAAFVLDHALMVATPNWTVRGASRTLFEKIAQRGLRVLSARPHPELTAPQGLVNSLAEAFEFPDDVLVDLNAVTRSPQMFCAGTPGDEVREIVRRALASGHALDEIEIACTDRDTYGVALDALCAHIKANTTTVDGIPLAASRIGRALERWFAWLESDYAVVHIRGALESGDWQIALDSGAVVGTQLVAELRRLRIGWGFAATRRATERLRSAEWRTIKHAMDGETSEAVSARQQTRNRNADALLSLLDRLLELSAIDDGAGSVSAAKLAQSTIGILELIEPHGPAERATLQRLTERLVEFAGVSYMTGSLPQGLAAVRQALSDLRAWTDTSATTRPRRATGGHMHLTGLESAGATGRPLLFIVGLDADRTAGPVLQSPLLPDSLRVRLNERGADLPTIEHRRRERAWHLASAMTGSDSELSLSYAIRGGEDGREASPAPALLHVARESDGQPDMGYDGLRKKIGAPASPVPDSPDHAIDARDVLLAHMSDGALLLNGSDAARSLFPGLERGLTANDIRRGDEVGAFHGLVPAAGRIDPRATQTPISPSSLEMIAQCSMRWFYANALNARLPEEPVFDAMSWLDARERGTALHKIYEQIVRARLYEQPASVERAARTAEIVQGVADELSQTIPAASAAVRAREIAALDSDAALFVNGEHDAYQQEPWEVVALELPFGTTEDAVIPLDDGTSVRVHGRIDRVDRLRDGTLRLIDYKTGRAFEWDKKRGAFNDGRKLQLAVYSPAVSQKFGADVSAAEYHFPTQKGDGAVARADRELLELAPGIVRSLLDDVANGRFVATVDPDDCAFCEYAQICRVRIGDYHKIESPRAEWAQERVDSSPHYAGVLRRKTPVGDDS